MNMSLLWTVKCLIRKNGYRSCYLSWSFLCKIWDICCYSSEWFREEEIKLTNDTERGNIEKLIRWWEMNVGSFHYSYSIIANELASSKWLIPSSSGLHHCIWYLKLNVISERLLKNHFLVTGRTFNIKPICTSDTCPLILNVNRCNISKQREFIIILINPFTYFIVHYTWFETN